jgi:hypothetical protein
MCEGSVAGEGRRLSWYSRRGVDIGLGGSLKLDKLHPHISLMPLGSELIGV